MHAYMVYLKVRKSAIAGEGIARVNIQVLSVLGIEPGDNIVVRHGKKSIIVTVFGDDLVVKDDIRLRAKDMMRLGVIKGECVEVLPYVPLILKKKAKYRGIITTILKKVHR